VSLVNGTDSSVTFSTLLNINSQLLYASTFETKFNALASLLELFTPESESLDTLIEMFLEAGLLTPIISLL
jgi:hypothetical protein